MNIAYVVGRFPQPSEQFIGREIEALRGLGADVTVYPIECDGGPACPWCVLGRHLWLSALPRTWRAMARFPLGSLASLRLKAWKEYPGGLSLAARYARDAEARRIEHVHVHFLTKPAAVGAMMAAMLRVPLSLSAHARDVFVDGIAARHKVSAAGRVAVCNRAALDALRAKLPASLHGRLTLIRHGLDLRAFDFRPDRAWHSEPRLLAAGRFVEKKGFGHLIDAVGELDGWTCEIAGSGPLEAGLRRQVEQRGLAGRIAFPGWLPPDGLRGRMAEADALVVPSVVAGDGDRDGVPNVLLEAAAAGLPIVACDAGGIGEFVIDGETGRLVLPGDPAALAEGLRSAASDPEATRRLAEGARKKVENEYDLRENTTLLMDLFTRPGPPEP